MELGEDDGLGLALTETGLDSRFEVNNLNFDNLR